MNASSKLAHTDNHHTLFAADHDILKINDAAITRLVQANMLPFSSSLNNTAYKCPSIKSFQLPINDFKITDILKRHELTLPEINKNKLIYDPLLAHQIERQLPEYQKETQNAPMYCGRPLWGEIKWRKRMMNIKKRKKYQVKMFYVIQTRKQSKEKRYQKICDMYKSIQEKKTEIFTPMNFIVRELEKAKFYGYSCSKIYNGYRRVVEDSMKSFDEKYTRKFVDPKLPVCIVWLF